MLNRTTQYNNDEVSILTHSNEIKLTCDSFLVFNNSVTIDHSAENTVQRENALLHNQGTGVLLLHLKTLSGVRAGQASTSLGVCQQRAALGRQAP